MAVIHKLNKVSDNLFLRQEYLVTQSNDVAYSFWNLTAFQYELLDFCFSPVQKYDIVDKIYKMDVNTIIHYFGLTLSEITIKELLMILKLLIIPV